MIELINVNGQLLSNRLKTYSFLVSIDGYDQLTQAGFQEVRGLDEEIQQLKIAEPGRIRPHTFPNASDGRIITLVRGLDFESALSDWIRAVKEWEPGRPDYRKNFSIYLMTSNDYIAYAARGWDIFDAWPITWAGPEPNSMAAQLAFESVTLYCEAVQDAPLQQAVTITI